MKEWWNRKKEKSRKRRKNNGNYTFLDFIMDVLFWVPELLVLPFRILIWLLRGLGRFIKNLFDFI